MTSHRLVKTKASLWVVDIQERLLPAMHEPTRVVQNSLRLIQGCNLMNVPVWVTEQYRKGLGATVLEVAAAVPSFAPMEKLTFSACGVPGLTDRLRAQDITDVIVCGIEAHVCVTQTALDLRDQGFRVFAVTDATSSRTPENHRAGLERMRDAGATLVSVEMVLFELLERAGTAEFKQILNLVK